MIEVWLGPARVVWTDRHGGVSAAPYDTANLADHVGDAPASVEENRVRAADRIGLGDPTRWWWLRQVHGATVVTALGPARDPALPPEADAAVTAAPGVPLTVLTADCAPLALASDDAIAVVHAGWVGLLAGVVAAAVDRLRELGRGEVRAALGPCVHPDHYEFGADDLATLVDRFGPTVASHTADGSPAFALPEAVRRALLEAGVTDLLDVGVCTAASPDHFSHRQAGNLGANNSGVGRSGAGRSSASQGAAGRTGRQALIAVLVPQSRTG